MTAAVLYGKEDIKIEKVTIPTLERGEVLVKVNVALTCGTDLKVFQRGYHARMIGPPALFGHELSGVIAEVGPGVRDIGVCMKGWVLSSARCARRLAARVSTASSTRRISAKTCSSTTAPTPSTSRFRAGLSRPTCWRCPMM